MDKEIIKKERKILKSLLGEIVGIFNKINIVMKNIPHVKGTAHRSLKPKSKTHDNIRHRKGFVTATFQHTDGIVYEICISRKADKESS